MTVARDVAANIAVAGVLAVGAGGARAAPPAPGPGPPPAGPPSVPIPPPAEPVDPAAPPPTALGTMNSILAPGQPAGPSGAPDFLLSQNQVPAVPGSQPAAPPSMNVLDSSQYLLPQNFQLVAPDQGTLYGVAPGSGNAAKWDQIRGAHALWHGGLGKLSPEQLGQPLPGTAPPPGTAIPPGVVDYLPVPDEPPVLPPPAG
jgi:hypothetical protein